MNQTTTQPLTIGIDFGGTSVKFGVVSQSQIIEMAQPLPTQEYETAKDLIAAMAETIQSLQKKHPDVLAIGGGIPGFIDVKKGLVYDLPNVSGWKEIPLASELTQLTKLPCTIDNDANCMAYAEWKHGAGKGMEHLVCITLGTGVGGGIISENRMIRGSRCSAGEIGQTSIDYQGVQGKYNNIGCIEDYIGNRQITQLAHTIYHERGVVHSLNECSPKELTRRADNGDVIAMEIWSMIAEKLACTLMSSCWIFNPEAIVIGGGVAMAGKHLFEPLDQFIRSQLTEPFRDQLQIIPAAFSNDAGIIGAAAMALDYAE